MLQNRAVAENKKVLPVLIPSPRITSGLASFLRARRFTISYVSENKLDCPGKSHIKTVQMSLILKLSSYFPVPTSVVTHWTFHATVHLKLPKRN